MTRTASLICLFHDRRYSSNIQCILNLLRRDKIKIKCDLNKLGKECLCTCKLPSSQMIITDEQFNKRQEEFEKLKIDQQWSDEIDQIIHLKIMNTCDSQISIYKLFTLVCEISNEETFLKMIKTKGKVNLINDRSHHSNFISRRMKLSLYSNQISHLVGRNGHLHKKIMSQTQTRIRFNNVPYTSTSSKQCPDFNLDLFQSPRPLTATITGLTKESVENAAKALEKLVRTTQINHSRRHKN